MVAAASRASVSAGLGRDTGEFVTPGHSLPTNSLIVS